MGSRLIHLFLMSRSLLLAFSFQCYSTCFQNCGGSQFSPCSGVCNTRAFDVSNLSSGRPFIAYVTQECSSSACLYLDFEINAEVLGNDQIPDQRVSTPFGCAENQNEQLNELGTFDFNTDLGNFWKTSSQEVRLFSCSTTFCNVPPIDCNIFQGSLQDCNIATENIADQFIVNQVFNERDNCSFSNVSFFDAIHNDSLVEFNECDKESLVVPETKDNTIGKEIFIIIGAIGGVLVLIVSILMYLYGDSKKEIKKMILEQSGKVELAEEIGRGDVLLIEPENIEPLDFEAEGQVKGFADEEEEGHVAQELAADSFDL